MFMEKEKPKMTRSLARTLLLAFLGLTLMALLIAYIPQLFFFVQEGNRAITSEQQVIAQEAANTVADFVQVRFDVLETAVRLSDFASGGNPREFARAAICFPAVGFCGCAGAETSRCFAPVAGWIWGSYGSHRS